ncbi:S1/P1 nuclease [Nostoc sp. HG1]|nr:S1/P1 nuclease [Nostoc sp. HG1]
MRIPLAMLLMLMPAPALAWWEYGHETIARIAEARVQPATKRQLRRLIARAADLDTPTCPITTMAQASVWADCIKGLRDRYSYANSWHYQNVDICKPFDLKPACADGNCVAVQIDRNARLLADHTLPPRERLAALAFLVHFVGDLHQPMHAGDRGDRGGNDLRATYGTFAGRRLNLHAIWDGYLAERAISSPPGGVAGLLGEVQPGMSDGEVVAWSRENWQVARDAAYATAIGDPCGPVPVRGAIDQAEINALIPVVRKQVVRGGVRLARLLDEALAPPRPATPPSR